MIDLKDHRKVVFGFLDALKAQDYNLMLRLSQKTWAKGQKTPHDTIKEFYDWLKLLSYSVDSFKEVLIPEDVAAIMTSLPIPPGTMLDYKVRLTFRVGDRFYDRGIRLRMVCESEVFEPSVEGDWGVNPLSPKELRRETDRG